MNVKIHDMSRNVAISLENACRDAGINLVENYSDDGHELFDAMLYLENPGVEVKVNRKYFCLYYPEGDLVKVHRIHQDDFSEVSII